VNEPWRLLAGIELPDIPPTPQNATQAPPTAVIDMMLLAQASAYGQCNSYAQEQNGKIIQDIVPTFGLEDTQTSGSSNTPLAMHTETAFHPHRPSHVALLCLREDLNAITTLAHAEAAAALLEPEQRTILTQQRFHTTVDESFRQNGEPDQNVPITVLATHPDTGHVTCTYDESLTKGDDPLAARALSEFTDALRVTSKDIVLRKGQILIIDNSKVVHGRRAFKPKYDGTDRWFKRVLIFNYPIPHTDINGSTITTVDFISKKVS
jgi:L-asparagine oxygenase